MTDATPLNTPDPYAEANFWQAPEGWTESAVWTGSGYLDILDPDPARIHLEEIARGLARSCRFGPGIKGEPYSTAEHSVACARIMADLGVDLGWSKLHSRIMQRAALLHDAPEYVLGDMLGPIKRQCPDYQGHDDALSRAVEERFGLPGMILDSGEVRHAARLACDTEARVLLPEMPPWPDMSDGHRDGIARTTDPARYFLRTARSLGVM